MEHADSPRERKLKEVASIRSRVLIVDDEHSIADTLAAILTLAGFETLAVYSGAEAIAAAARFRPDILLADYHMPPGINGLEAAKDIKQLFPGCRVVMLSGQPLSNEFAPYRTLGFNFLLLSKPMHPKELLHTIKSEDVVTETTLHPRILNVDDVYEHRYSISRLLTKAGFEVSEAATGREAIKKAIESKPELILLDIRLPDIDGYDVCKALKEDPETSRISVVHITAAEKDQDAVAQSTNVGADEFLTHPMVPQRLIHRIRELLQLRYLNEK